MIAIRLDMRLEARLEALAKRTGRTKTYHATCAIEEYLAEQEQWDKLVDEAYGEDGRAMPTMPLNSAS